MKTNTIKRFSTFFIALAAAITMMLALCACAPKDIKVNVVDGDAATEVTTQEGKTVSDILSAADIAVEEGDEVSPALDTKIEKAGETITIERMNSVVIAVDGKNVDVDVLGGTVQDALDQAEITLASGDKVDVELTAPLEDEMLITVTRAPKEQPKATSSSSSSKASSSSSSSSKASSSSSKASGKTVVSRTKVPNCDDGSHGYEEIHYSDGTVEYKEY